MSVIAVIEVAPEDFTLGEVLAANPDVEVTLERVVPLGSTFIPYFWMRDDTVEDVERDLTEEADIESFRVVDRLDDEALVRVEWGKNLDGLLDAMAETEATLLEAVGSATSWRFQLRFDDHESLTTFYRLCAEQGISLDLRSVHTPRLPDDLGLGITDTQRETLEIALEKGYFDVPRRINLSDLATEMGVSDTAVSQRIRRGITTLLTTSLSESDEESADR